VPTRALRSSTPPPDYRVDVSERLRIVRTGERFTQDELAADIGITRAALGNYEYNIRPLPFGVGLRWCERLDINPAFLVEGGPHPERPYVKPSDLEIDGFALQKLASRRTPFEVGYFQILREPLRRWFAINTPARLILKAINAGAAPVAARLSAAQLDHEITRTTAEMLKASGPDQIGLIAVVRTYLEELEKRSRLAGRKRARSA
jgi:transcriptional regulator with XRE-family HTH domain